MSMKEQELKMINRINIPKKKSSSTKLHKDPEYVKKVHELRKNRYKLREICELTNSTIYYVNKALKEPLDDK